MNVFDAAVLGFTLLAVVFGFNAGLLCSLATILGYLIAAPFALAVAPPLALRLVGSTDVSGRAGLVLFAVFALSGILIGALLRRVIGDAVGASAGPIDRVAGAALGAVRTVLLAVLMVMIFDQIIPPNLEPEWLTQSRLRPILSAAGRQGLRALPPDVVAYIDRLKKERGL